MKTRALPIPPSATGVAVAEAVAQHLPLVLRGAEPTSFLNLAAACAALFRSFAAVVITQFEDFIWVS